MSYFDEPKNAGLLLLIIGVLSVVLGIVSLFLDGLNFTTDIKLAGIMSCIGSVIGGLIYCILGADVKKGSCRIQIANFFGDVESKYGLLIAVIAASSIGGIISGICTIIGGTVAFSIFSIVLSIILLIFAYMMASGTAGKVIWIILLILFILSIIGSIILCFAIVGIPMLLLYIMLTCFLISPEVKEQMQK